MEHFDITASDFFVGADKHTVRNDPERVSHYTLNKVQRDHGSFVNVLNKHFTGRKHKWSKVVTNKSITHVFRHSNPKAPTVKIRRLHRAAEPSYLVRVAMPHPDDHTKNVYKRAMRSRRPSKTLDKMLAEARASRNEGKQLRKPRGE